MSRETLDTEASRLASLPKPTISEPISNLLPNDHQVVGSEVRQIGSKDVSELKNETSLDDEVLVRQIGSKDPLQPGS